MSDSLDREIIADFVQESRELLRQCEEALSAFAGDASPKHFEDFGLYVDRIMGAADTLGLKNLATLARQGKEIGYKASQVQDIEKLLAVSGLLSQLLKEGDRSLGRISRMDLSASPGAEALFQKLQKGNEALGNLRATVKHE